jgi:sRNA-binding carbon storage regulator CsrA
VYEVASGETVECDVVRTTGNVVTLGFCSPQTTNSLRVLVIKIA